MLNLVSEPSQHAAPSPPKGLLRLRALVCFAYGALLNFAFPPTGMWLFVLALPLLFALVARSHSWREAFGLGFWFGFGFFAQHLFWLPNSLSRLFGPVAWGLYPPIILIEGVFWGLVTGLSRAAGRRGTGPLIILPALWLLMEWARTQGPLAFPWGAIGYVWLDTPLAQGADLAGSYGLSFATLVAASLLALPFVVRRRFRGPALLAPVGAAALLGGVWAYGVERLTGAPLMPDQQALLVQGNTDPLGRALGETNESDFDIYLGLTSAYTQGLDTPPELVVWPEGAILGREAQLEGLRGEASRLRIRDSALGSDFILGAGAGAFNSVYGVVEGRLSGRYDKVYLVPFGEGVPFSQQLRAVYTPIYALFGFGPGGRIAGTEFVPVRTSGVVAASYICYESVFPQVARHMVAQGANVLVNISNDAWFGVGNGADQHFAMGTMRAIETRRYLLRAGNDGITAVVDPQGRTLERLPRFEASALLAEYALSEVVTPYVRYGDLLIWVVAGYALVFMVVSAVRHRSAQRSVAKLA